MPGLPDLTGQNIQTTYQRVLQTDGVNIYDGTGSLFSLPPVFPYTGSAAITGSLDVIGNTVITGSLIVSGSNGGIDTSNSYLNDVSAILSVDWSNRQLVGASGDLSIDWTNKQLIDSSGISVYWSNRQLVNTSGNVSIDWENKYLYSSNGANAFSFNNAIYTYSSLYHASLKNQGTVQEGFSADDSSFAGDIIYASIHTSVTASNLVYLESGDGKWYPVNQATTGSTKMLGICLDTGKGRDGIILLEGHVTVNDDDSGIGPYVPGVDHGLPIYIESGSLASMSTITPISGYVRLLGHAYYNNTGTGEGGSVHHWIMKFKPDNYWRTV